MRRRLVALAIAVVLPLPGLAAEVTVQPGETLSQIADRLGVSMTRLMSRTAKPSRRSPIAMA